MANFKDLQHLAAMRGVPLQNEGFSSAGAFPEEQTVQQGKLQSPSEWLRRHLPQPGEDAARRVAAFQQAEDQRQRQKEVPLGERVVCDLAELLNKLDF